MNVKLLLVVLSVSVLSVDVKANLIVSETLTGVITSGGDVFTGDLDDQLGAPASTLVGQAFTFSFSYDTTLLQAAISGTGSMVDFAGDGAFNASLAVNSHTVFFSNKASTDIGPGFLVTPGNVGVGYIYTGDPNLSTATFQIVIGNGNGSYLEAFINTPYSSGNDLYSQTTVDALMGGASTGSLDLFNGIRQSTLLGFTHGATQPSSPVPAPEPGTWILSGFALSVTIAMNQWKGSARAYSRERIHGPHPAC